jgi:hypothetical protein
MNIKRFSISLLLLPTLLTATAQDTQIDPRVYQLFTPITFYHGNAAQNFSMATRNDAISQEVAAALMNIYLSRPDLVTATETEMLQGGTLRKDIIEQKKQVKQKVSLTNQAAPTVSDDEMGFDPVSLVVEKPNFWTLKGDAYLQFLQNYVSDNWYKGGESNYSAVGIVNFEANFDNQQGFKWDNKLEMKLGFQTSPTDTVHKFKTNNDLLRYTGKLGVQASKRWYYTLQVLAYTQFMRGYKANKEFTYSDFMSPLNLNVGLGMDYKLEAMKKRLTGTVNLSPISVNYRYVDRDNLVTSFGIDEDKHHKTDVGSQITANATWVINNVVTWKSRLYFFTSYKRTEAEWENTFELKVSKYITANIFLFPRFDDSSKTRDEDLGFFQFKEYSSLGFAYNF